MKYILTIALICFTALAQASDNYDLIVAKDGSGDYTTIQAAIDATKAFPPERKSIYIKKGTYHEKVKVHAWNNLLSIIGEDAESTIITYDDYFKKINRDRNSTFMTWTLLVQGNDCIMKNLTIQNTAGAVGQALALSVEADRCSFENIRILGHQDALYAAGQNCRQYYKNCYIEGTTDFIFGAATALFEDCTINSKSNSYITAASTPKGAKFGYVFLNCKITAEEGIEKVSLGRPWRDYAKVVFINCELGAHIKPQGWNNWNKTNRDQTAFYAEYNNYGPGANTENRLDWTHQLKRRAAKKYTKNNILAPHFTSEPSTEEWAN